jgi:hypothetical protein
MFEGLKTLTDQGNIGEARAIFELVMKGWFVSKPLFVNSKYDLIVDTGESLLKVSVKTSGNMKGDGFEVNLATRGGNSSKNTIKSRQKNDFDLLFVLVDSGDCYLIPSIDLGEAKYSIVVGRTKYNEFKIGSCS